MYSVLEELPGDSLAFWRPSPEMESAFETEDGALDVISVRGERLIELARSRLRLITRTDGRTRAAVGVFDSATNEECFIVETVSGLRCLPEQKGWRALAYREPACTESVWALSEPGAQLQTGASNVVTAITDYRTPDPGLFFRKGDECRPHDGVLYIATSTSLEDFVALTVVVE